MKKYFELGDRHPAQKNSKYIKAIWNKEFREPKKGQWYLSGCKGFIKAYKAPNDLLDKYFIANIVEVETWTTIKIIKVLGDD